ncbi:hypothetical protein NU195Hw_g2831t1 [Hortaea werneckii]
MEGFSLEIPCQSKVCEAFARGECRFGEKCTMLHPLEVSPQCQPEIDYKFSREAGEACTRCVQTGFPCDKPGRPEGDAHPCSECRWFAGSSARCTLTGDSRNDAMWKIMINSNDSALPPYKARDEARLRKGQSVSPSPMADDKIARDWQGESREQLLAKGDPLPAEVRARPRAYLTPPGISRRQEKTAAFHASAGKKRKADEIKDASASQAETPYSMPTYSVPDIPAPPRDSRGAHATKVIFEFSDGTVISARVTYPGINGEKGVELVSYPAQKPQASSAGPPVQR